jgi:hypothetical protein
MVLTFLLYFSLSPEMHLTHLCFFHVSSNEDSVVRDRSSKPPTGAGTKIFRTEAMTSDVSV